MESATSSLCSFSSDLNSFGFENSKGAKHKSRAPPSNFRRIPGRSMGGSGKMDEKLRLFFVPFIPAL